MDSRPTVTQGWRSLVLVMRPSVAMDPGKISHPTTGLWHSALVCLIGFLLTLKPAPMVTTGLQPHFQLTTLIKLIAGITAGEVAPTTTKDSIVFRIMTR